MSNLECILSNERLVPFAALSQFLSLHLMGHVICYISCGLSEEAMPRCFLEEDSIRRTRPPNFSDPIISLSRRALSPRQELQCWLLVGLLATSFSQRSMFIAHRISLSMIHVRVAHCFILS